MTNSYTEDIVFQAIFSLMTGLFFSMLSYHIFYTISFVILYEIYIIFITRMYPPHVRFIDRVIVNIFFFTGWILARVFYCNETGCEAFSSY